MRDFRKANLGMTLEEFMTFSNQCYRRDGVAVVWKVPTPFKPIRNAYGQVVNCKVEGKSCVDYLGRVGSVPLAAEAKETRDDSIRFDRVEDHQAEFMDDFTKHQCGIGIVVVSFNLERFYSIPWECWKAGRDAWKAAQRAGKRKAEQIAINYHGQAWMTPGRASVKECELLPEWRVETGGRYGLDYLRRYIPGANKPCGGCICNYCANNVNGRYKPGEMVEPCFECDDCRDYDGDPNKKCNRKKDCKNFKLTEYQAARNREKIKLLR